MSLGAAPLPESLRHSIRQLMDRDGERLAVAKLRVSRHLFARALAGLPIYAGSHALIRQQLDAIHASERAQS